MTRRRDRAKRQRGAVLVEFALVAPLLFLLVFGVIEFGWAYTQYLDVRHGARETARLVAVNYHVGSATGTTQSNQILAEACDRMDTASGATITIEIPSGSTTGNRARVLVTTPLDTITGFFDPVLSTKTLRSEVFIRLEDDATWVSTTATCP